MRLRNPARRPFPIIRAAGIAALSLASAPALADGVRGPAAVGEAVILDCSARDAMISHLKQRYGEEFTGRIRRSERGLVELYAADSGSWTLLLTLPDGRSCPLAVGSDAEQAFPGEMTRGERI